MPAVKIIAGFDCKKQAGRNFGPMHDFPDKNEVGDQVGDVFWIEVLSGSRHDLSQIRKPARRPQLLFSNRWASNLLSCKLERLTE